MTNETITNETPIDNNKKRAMDFVHSHSLADVVDHLASLYDAGDSRVEANRITRNRLQHLVDTVTEFIKDNLSEGADSDSLKELANELDIELTKNLRITFNVSYYADVTVPLDFDEQTIDDSDFDVSIRYRGSDDVDFADESTEVEDFEIEENQEANK